MTRLLLCLSIVALVVAAPGAGPQQTVFRGSSDTVRVYVTVLDKNERLASGLTREQFEVRDNGKPQPITLFDNSPQPIRLIVMLDVSGSMKGNLPLMREACRQLFARLGPEDVARVGTFGREVVISPKFTRDSGELLAALPAEIVDAPTPLWRGVDEAIQAFGADSDVRRVVLVLSDGKDSGPTSFRTRYVGQLDVVERARAAEVMIYGIGMRSRGGAPMSGDLGAMLAADMPDPGLGTAAIETGGGYFELRPRDDLATAFTRVADELHSQYLLGFVPPQRDGKSHKLEVRVTGGMKPRARKSYIAPAEAK